MNHCWHRAIFGALILCFAAALGADEQNSAINSAKIEVTDATPTPLVESENWRKPPEFLDHATIYFNAVTPTARLHFRIKESGLVVMAASFSYDGDQIDEPWTDDCKTFIDLTKEGWTVIGVLNSPKTSRHYLFRKIVKAGEEYNIQTRFHYPPYVILVPDQDAKRVMDIKPWVEAGRKTPMILGPAEGEPKGQSPDAQPQVVSLRFHEPVQSLLYMRFGVLLREIVQQGVSVAANEQLGLPTRDTSLRDVLPQEAQPGRGELKVVTIAQPLNSVDIAIYQHQGKEWKALWDAGERLPPKDFYENLTTLVEKWSRSDFVDVLHQAGFQGAALPTTRDTAELPEGVDKLLADLSIPAQFAAVRKLQAETRKSGESPELLGALARGYATLGVLTEELWSTAPQVFKARALIYAERAVQTWPKSAQALENRAYVRALVGLHRTALDDLKAADELRAAAKTSDGTAEAAQWTKALEAFCQFDADALEAAEQQDSNKAFVRLLQLLSAEYSSSERDIINATGELLHASPGCLRAVDGAMRVQQISFHRQVLDFGTKLTEKVLLAQVAEIPDLPAEPAKLIADFQKASKVSGIARLLGAKAPDEMSVRLKVIEMLREAGKPENDSLDPSWQVLAQLLDEIDFIQAWWQVDVAANWLGWQPDQFIEAVTPQIEHHPYAPFIASFASDPEQSRSQMKKLTETVDTATFSLNEIPIVWRANQGFMNWVNTHWSICFYPDDVVARDLCITMKHAKYPKVIASELQDVSPSMPYGVAMAIEQNVGSVRASADELEKKYAKSAVVQAALGKYYNDANKTDDAIRCYKQAIQTEPTYANYYWLAAIYERLKDEDKWLGALEDYLKTEDYGLGHAQVQVQIANHFIEKREWKKAQGYAEAAAQSWAGWAMLSAAECAEAQQDWQPAEQWYKNLSERYQDSASEWYFFCRRTGQGDQQKALELAMNLVRSLEKRSGDQEWLLAGGIRELLGQKKEAAQDYDKSFTLRSGSRSALCAALLYDELGDTQQRDRILDKVHGAQYTQDTETQTKVALCELIRNEVGSGKSEKVDLDAIQKIIDGDSAAERPDMYYFAGKYLSQHGEPDKAIEFWKMTMNSTNLHSLCRTLAGATLWDHGITPATYQDALLKKPDDAAAKDHSN